MQNDLISRSALKAAVASMNNNLSGVQMLIDNAPAVDAVEIGSCDGCHWKEIGRQQKCSCCRRNRHMKDNYERRCEDG